MNYRFTSLVHCKFIYSSTQESLDSTTECRHCLNRASTIAASILCRLRRRSTTMTSLFVRRDPWRVSWRHSDVTGSRDMTVMWLNSAKRTTQTIIYSGTLDRSIKILFITDQTSAWTVHFELSFMKRISYVSFGTTKPTRNPSRILYKIVVDKIVQQNFLVANCSSPTPHYWVS